MTGHFKDQINKLTAIINSAVGRKNCRPGQPSNPTSTSTRKTRRQGESERLCEMILKMQDGVLEKKYIARLEKWLSCDPEALKYYVQFNQLSAMLHALYNKKYKKLKHEQLLAKS